MAGKDSKKAVPLLPAVPEDEIRQEVITDNNTRYVLHLRRQVLEQYGKSGQLEYRYMNQHEWYFAADESKISI